MSDTYYTESLPTKQSTHYWTPPLHLRTVVNLSLLAGKINALTRCMGSKTEQLTMTLSGKCLPVLPQRRSVFQPG